MLGQMSQFGGPGGFTGSTIQPENQPEYPYAPPQEHQLKNDLHNSSLVDAAKTKQTLIFCYICDFPMNARVVLRPCNHVICYSCYALHPNECKMCEEEIQSIVRLPDNERIPYTEDDFGYPIYKLKPDQKS